jgi:hypothetical protein
MNTLQPQCTGIVISDITYMYNLEAMKKISGGFYMFRFDVRNYLNSEWCTIYYITTYGDTLAHAVAQINNYIMNCP